MTKAQGTATGFAPFSREEMDLASKDQLIRWCKEYGLDESGMKYELRLRLLEYIRRQGLLLKGEEALEEEAAPPEGESTAAPAPPQESATGEEEAAQTIVEPPADPAGAESQGTCPNCGGELSYIPQYARWYCYNCDTYAAQGPAASNAAVAEASRIGTTHDQAWVSRSPKAGVALALAGLLTFITYQILFVAPAFFPIPVFVTVAPEVLFALPLIAHVLLGVGVIAGLWSLGHHG